MNDIHNSLEIEGRPAHLQKPSRHILLTVFSKCSVIQAALELYIKYTHERNVK